MMAACVLTDQPVTLTNVPWIDDVRVMLDLLESMGVETETDGRTLRLCAASVRGGELDAGLCRRVRSSILLAGPLAARQGRVTLHPPGGDVIGRRRLDTHFSGLEALGIEIRADRSYTLKRRNLQGASILLDEASVTATENILMAAVLAPGRTVLYNAACEPHVQDLGVLLNKMGARITGLGTNRIVVEEGVAELGGAEHAVQPDHIEIGSFAAAAAATGGTLRIPCGPDTDSLRIIERAFQQMGVPWRVQEQAVEVGSGDPLQIASDLGMAIPKIEDGPWPSFPSDLMSVAIVLATRAEGSILFFEKMFESRMYFVDQLIAMGARIVQCDPHRVVVSGPSALHGAHMATPDIRAGMALLIAALCAEGTSVIENASIIDRGYEFVDQRLRDLGADIQREE